MAGLATVTPITKNPRAARARSNSENLIGFARDLIKAGYTPESVPDPERPFMRETVRVMRWILDGKGPGK
jgi:hypothetical protein